MAVKGAWRSARGLLIAPWCGLLVLMLAACGETQPRQPGTPFTVEVIRDATTDLADLGEYVRAIPLETHEDAQLGVISAIRVMPRGGDLLVGDFKVQKAIFRFDGAGRFLRRYGQRGQGPGEYQDLLGFAPMEDGRIVVLGAFKLMLLDGQGGLVAEVPVRMAANWVETIRGRIYVRAVRGMQAKDQAVLVFDERLREIARFHPRDRRLDKVAYIPNHPFSMAGERVYLSEIYDYRVTAYDLDGQWRASWAVPNTNEDVQPLLGRPGKLKQKELETLFGLLHRPRYLYAFPGFLYLLEVKSSERLMRSCLLDPDSRRLTVFENLRLVHPDASDAHLTMSGLAGSYDEGLIGYLDDPEVLARFRHRVAVLANVPFRAVDNPVVLFFRLNPPRTDPTESAAEAGEQMAADGGG